MRFWAICRPTGANGANRVCRDYFRLAVTREQRGSVELVGKLRECIGDFASTEEAVLLLQISESRLGHFAAIRRLPN